ncbi:MAG: alpha/beta hydrolase [Nakamurella sp.]
MDIAQLSDGTAVVGTAEGAGPLILVVPPGSDDGSGWAAVARHLTDRFRVVRLHRRQYRLDVDNPTGFPLSVELEEVRTVIERFGPPILLVGHSSGAVVALEDLVNTRVTGAVLYEPPVNLPGMDWAEPLGRASAAIAAGQPGRAMTIFARDIVKTPPWVAAVGGGLISVLPRYRAMAPRQIFDTKAIYELGIRLDAYGTISTPTLLLSGERSPQHLGERVDRLADVMPTAEKVIIAGQGHTANRRAPAELAELIAGFYRRLLG